MRPSAPLGAVAARGVAWLLMQSLLGRLVVFAAQLVLAWLLVPADFGRLGLALTVSTVASTLVSFGVDDVLLQRQRTARLWSPSAFWVSLLLGLAGAALILGAAPAAAALYRAPELIGLLAILAASLPLNALATVPTVNLRAALRFDFIAVYSVIEVLAVQGLTILLAWRGMGAYSFVIPVPLAAALRAGVFWAAARPKMRLRLRPSHALRMARTSSAVFGQRVVTTVRSQSDVFLLGLFATQGAVGLYFFALRLAAQPIHLLASGVVGVLFPVLMKLQQEPERQVEAVLRSARVLAFAVFPLSFLQAAVAEPLLLLFFGDKWRDAIPLIQLLSIGLAFDAVSWTAAALLNARGEFRRGLVYTGLLFPVFVAVAAAGAASGAASGLAIAVAAFYVVAPPLYAYAVFRRYGVGALRTAGLYAAPAASAALAAGGAYLLSLTPGLRDEQLLRVLVIGAAGPAAYLFLTSLLTPAVLRDALDQARSLLARQGRAAPAA